MIQAARRVPIVLGLSLALVVTVASAALDGKSPQILITAHSRISQLQADGGHLAWAAGCDLHVYSVTKATQIRVARGCQTAAPENLRLTGQRVYWSEEGYSNTEYWWKIQSAAPHHRRTVVDSANLNCAGTNGQGNCECYSGRELGGMVGSGRTFVYKVYDSTWSANCASRTFHSAPIYRVVSRRGQLHRYIVPQADAVEYPLAASPGRFALMSYDGGSDVVDIRSARTGLPVSEIALGVESELEGFAMSDSIAALDLRPTNDLKGAAIAWFSLPSGNFVGMQGLGTDPESMSASGKRIVYQRGTHKVWYIPRGADNPRLLYEGDPAPRGVQIEGRRVFWFKNSSKRARIYELQVR